MRILEIRRRMRAEVFFSALCFLGRVIYIFLEMTFSPDASKSSEQEAMKIGGIPRSPSGGFCFLLCFLGGQCFIRERLDLQVLLRQRVEGGLRGEPCSPCRRAPGVDQMEVQTSGMKKLDVPFHLSI